jgi:hypothetical protein
MRWEAQMFHTQGNTQVYSPFGSYVVEQHDIVCLKRYIEDLPRPDLKLGKGHPLAQGSQGTHQAA